VKVFVTGSEGFIGSHVVEELVRRGYSVSAMVQYNSQGSDGWIGRLDESIRSAIEIVHGDVRDAGLVASKIRGHGAVLHLAALVAIPYSYLAPASYIETNVLGTLNVLEASKLHEVDRVIHTSTSEVYGTARYVPINEHHPLVGQSPYSASKIAADQLAHSYWSAYGVPVTTIRPFNAYGPRQSQRAFIPSVMVQLLAGKAELQLGSLDPTRDLTFVKDTARGFVDALESDLGAGETFNMGSEFEVSMAEVVGMVCEISGINAVVQLDEDRIRPAASEVERLWSDSSKMRDTFGWKPEFSGKTGLYRGLELTYSWLEEHRALSGYDASRYVV